MPHTKIVVEGPGVTSIVRLEGLKSMMAMELRSVPLCGRMQYM